jgi:hypothetical protein
MLYIARFSIVIYGDQFLAASLGSGITRIGYIYAENERSCVHSKCFEMRNVDDVASKSILAQLNLVSYLPDIPA